MEHVTAPDPHVSPRRAARAAAERAAELEAAAPARHARRTALRVRRVFAAVAASVLVVGGAVSITAALNGTVGPDTAEAVVAAVDPPERSLSVEVVPLPEEGLPAPTMSMQATGSALCDDPAFTAALGSGDDAAVIAAAGGGAAFRTAVATGAAACIPLDDPNRIWVVVNKLRPYAPIDHRPGDLVMPEGVRSLEESALRAEAAGALAAMVRAAADAGAGELASESAFRSYSTQQVTYAGHVSNRGVEGADLVSARPGYSEHQSGLTVDVVPCDGSCASIDDIAGSPQGDWLVAHAWEHGWIVRYEEGRTDVTGYVPEPWHLRYIGVDLARAYHEGGWTTLEEFFGLPPAPGYAS
jgi:zinc D-Ala-D-Ala carboxypeptidase